MIDTEKGKKSDLPFGSEFSPTQIKLLWLFDLAHKYDGDWRQLEHSILNEYFSTNKTTDTNKKKLANNVKLGMQAYGLLDKEGHLTEFGKELFSLQNNENEMYKRFARHILLNLNGLNLVQCILDIQTSGESVDLQKLRHWLHERGIHFPKGGKHPSMMRLWLEKAGVFTSGWFIDEKRLKEVSGISTDDLDILSQFTLEQKAFLKTIANIGESMSHISSDIEKLASSIYGVQFNEKNLPKQVLYPLEQAGYIQLTRGTKELGRGAKPFLVTPTSKLTVDVIIPVLNQLDIQIQSDLRVFLRKSLKDIIINLNDTNTYKRGLALEALAFKLMRLLDMTYVATRLRGAATGGAEVDVIFESTRLVFSRWQIQCKNSASASLDDVAKEVGLTHFLKSNVIIIVTTGRIGTEARKYSNKVMMDSNLCIVLLDGKDVDEIVKNPTLIVDVFNREAKQAMKLKTLEL